MEPNNDCDGKINFAIALAERELRAFITAVSRSYGTEQARIAADDWLSHLLVHTRSMPDSGAAVREITLATAAQLASRVVGVAARAC